MTTPLSSPSDDPKTPPCGAGAFVVPPDVEERTTIASNVWSTMEALKSTDEEAIRSSPTDPHQLWHAVFAIDGQPEPTEVYVAIRSGVAKEAAVAALARSSAPESPGFRWISLSHLGVIHIPQL